MFFSPEEARLTILLFIAMIMAVLITCTANAYVPSTQFIFNRLAAQHGKGEYSIDDEVTFHEGADTAIFHENWLVFDGGEMRVVAVSDDGGRIFKIMKRGRVYWLEEGSSEHSDEVGPDQFMRVLLTRSAVDLKRTFVNWGIMPSEVLREKKMPKEVKDLQYEPETFVRLGRIAGTVAYVYGTPAPVEGTAPAGLWIEQDVFNIRKLRTPDSSEISLNDYATYARGLAFPRSQTILWGNHEVNVRVTKVNGVNLSGEQRRQTEPSWFRGHSDAATHWPKANLTPVIQDFYKHFR
jgi:hypothetical protein